MSKLHLGVMTRSELAEWFKITPDYLSRKTTKQVKYEELKQYAKFEVLNKGQVNILEIYEEEYVKPSITRDRIERCKREICKHYPNPFYIVVSWASEEFYYNEMTEKERKDVSEGTVYNRYLDAMTEMFGSLKRKTEGECGNRKFCYTIWSDIKQEFRPLTQVENKIKNEVVMKYYGSKDVDIAEQISHVDGQYTNGEISKEEHQELIEILEGNPKERYGKFIEELETKLDGKTQRMYLCEWNALSAQEMYKKGYITEKQLRGKSDVK